MSPTPSSHPTPLTDAVTLPDLVLIYRGEHDGVAWFETVDLRGSANIYMKRGQQLRIFITPRTLKDMRIDLE